MNPVSTLSSKRTLLNPNAREFVPTSLKPSSSAALPTIGDETEPSTASDNGITISEKTVSSDTCLSDEESRKYWNAQLPDDILTPDTDFFIADAEDGIEPGSSISGASGSESSGIRDQSDYPTDDLAWERSGMYGKFLHDPVQVVSYDSAASHDIPRQLWEGEHTSSPYRFSPIIGSRSKQDSLPSTFDQVSMKDTNIVDPWHVLLSEFPNIPVRTLVDVYQANGGDLSLTMRELSRMKMQDEANLWHNVPLSTQFSPDLRPFSFSDPSTPEFVSRVSHVPEGVGMQHAGFTRVMRKNNSQWFYDHRGPSEFSLAPSVLPAENFSSKLLDGEPYGNRIESLHLHHKHRISSRNLADTDDALVSLRSELVREEARNHGRVRNAFMEQARQALYSGNRVLAKEANAKGQFYNRLMKAAQNKAAEIDMQRITLSSQGPTFGPGQTQHLDLHGQHGIEAIHMLKRNLSTLRLAARSSGQQQQVFISVGTGHQKGSRALARFHYMVKQYLVEEEHLQWTEPQPGVLKVVVNF